MWGVGFGSLPTQARCFVGEIMRIPYRLLGAVFVGAASLPLAASAAIFTYTASSGVNNWSTATGWNTTPVSATDTSLLFAPNLASGVVSTSTNNIVGSFQLNSLTFREVIDVQYL